MVNTIIQKSLGLTLIVLLVYSKNVYCQTSNFSTLENADIYWEAFLEEMAEEGFETKEWEEKLIELKDNPIPLNESTREMLESIPFLREEQIENLAYYLYRYAPMVSLSELLLVDGIDEKTLKWLKPFVCLGQSTTTGNTKHSKNWYQYGKQEFRLTLGRNLQEKNGYTSKDSTQKYEGGPESINLRYEFNYKSKIQFGLLIDKDPGELALSKNAGGLDRISAHVLIKDLAFLKNLVVGEYKVRFGQGLICNTNFSIGKGVMGNSPECMGSEVNRNFSAAESNGFCGLATTIILKKFEIESTRLTHPLGINLILLGSNKKLDSNNESNLFSTLYKTGLHRTKTERSTRHNLNQLMAGSHIGLRTKNIELGLSAIFTHYDANREKGYEVWNLNLIPGKTNYNASLDWKANWENIRIYGEFAIDPKFKTAGICGIALHPANRLRVNILARNYASMYYSEFGCAFSENSTVQNEKGIYTSVEFQPIKHIQVKAFCDLYTFPWMRYGVLSPSNGHESGFLIEKSLENENLLTLKVKFKSQLKNDDQIDRTIKTIQKIQKGQVRFMYSKKTSYWNIKITMDCNRYNEGKVTSYGWAIAQDLGYEFKKGLQIYGHYAFFQAQSYNNRIYLYEKGFPGTFSLPMLYGNGIKESIYIKLPLREHQLKIKIDNYILPSSSTLGNGLEQIEGDRRSAITLQYLYKF